VGRIRKGTPVVSVSAVADLDGAAAFLAD